MAQFRTTADLVDLVLRRSGELTDGNSPYEAQALDYLNQVHQSIINGGNEFDTDIDEAWVWAKAKQPIILELQPKVDTGTVSLTNGSEVGSFSSAPSASMEGRFLFITNRAEYFKIVSHVAGNTAFELDSAYPDTTGATLSFKVIKLDYELKSDYFIINSDNDKIDFYETAATELTATLTHGSYLAADLATEVDTQLTSAGGSAYTISFDSVKKKFNILSDGAGGGGILSLLALGTNKHRNALLTMGYDQENLTGVLTYEATYVKDGVVRLFEPMKVYRSNSNYGRADEVGLVSESKLNSEFPISRIIMGVPDRCAKVSESSDGSLVIRMNKYPEEATRMEIEYIPMPIDLKDNAASIPLIPRSFTQVLEFGATFYILLDKEDSKAGSYSQLASAKLKAMMKKNRKELSRTGVNYGQIISRRDNVILRRRLIFGEPD